MRFVVPNRRHNRPEWSPSESLVDSQLVDRAAARVIAATLLLILVAGCGPSTLHVAREYNDWQSAAASDSILSTQIFLIGDAGYADTDTLSPALNLFHQQLATANETSAAIFLGDNIYCCGLADTTDPRRVEDERHLDVQLNAVEGFAGRAFFVPGNHDWDNAGPDGLAAVGRQNDYIDNHLGYNAFLPDNGLPGPVEIALSDSITLVLLDTHWWFHQYEKPYGSETTYMLDSETDLFLQIDKVVKRNAGKLLVVAGHHPLQSNGLHAGQTRPRDHLFPLRNLHPALWIPLPIIGSLYPFGRKYIGGRQDLMHPTYRTFRRALSRSFAQHDGLIYAAGHDHNLQYFETDEGQHFIVSGAGSRPHPVGNDGASFAYKGSGHSVLNVYSDGSVWMEMWTPDMGGPNGLLLFRTRLIGASER